MGEKETTPFKLALAMTTSMLMTEIDAVFAGPNDDYENGGNGNDELYAQDGDDALEGRTRR